jgi:adhesin transport system outer membrane protein
MYLLPPLWRRAAALLAWLSAWPAAGASVLPELIGAALREHPAMSARAAGVQAAAADLDAARWQFFPSPAVALTRDHLSTGTPQHTLATVSVRQVLWSGGRLTAQQQRAAAGLEHSQAAARDTGEQLALQVVQGYGDWLATHLRRNAQLTSQGHHLRLRALVQRRHEQGLAAASDVTLAEARLDALQAELAMSEAQEDIALARLGQLVGRPLARDALDGALAAPHPLNGERAALLQQALARNPALQRAAALQAAQAATLQERRAATLPEIYLRAERGYGQHGAAAVGLRLTLGASASFGAGRAAASQVQAAAAQLSAAAAERESQQRSVTERLLADLALAGAAAARQQTLTRVLAASEELLASYDRQFLAGRKSWLDLMNAARELAQTETQLADVAAARVVATWRLAIQVLGHAAIAGEQP